LSILLHAIEIASKYVSAQVRAAGIFDLYGVEGTTNVQGYVGPSQHSQIFSQCMWPSQKANLVLSSLHREVVKKLDVIANEAFITALKRSKKVCVMVRYRVAPTAAQ
jgi:fructose-1,6-bisphosphatase